MNRITCRPISHRHRGMVYIAVLGAAVIVMTLAGAALLAGRSRLRTVDGASRTSSARLAAQSAIELSRQWINQDPAWRANRSNGTWATGLSIGGGTVTIQAIDAVDTSLANRPYDPLIVTATGNTGGAQQILQATLVASPTPLPLLASAIHSHDLLEINDGDTISAGTATISSSYRIKTGKAIIEGNAEAVDISATQGPCFGTLATIAARQMPPSTVPEMYAALGTPISTTLLDKQVLGPGVCTVSGVTPNAEGVYVIRSGSNVTIRNSRIKGTLVVIAPQVTLDIADLIEPYRADYPSLIVDGDLVLKIDSSNPLDAGSLGININLLGITISGSLGDIYPNEVRGLVHVTGAVTTSASPVLRGALIMGSGKISNNLTIYYDPNLYLSPPQGYTTRVDMVVKPNSIRQIVN